MSFHVGRSASSAVWKTLVVAVAATNTATRVQDAGRLLATSGVTQIKGSSGDGLVPWTLVTGYGTRDAVGANAHYTLGYRQDFILHSASASIGVLDQIEISYAHQWFDTRQAGAKLGLGAGYQFQLDLLGAKLRLFGEAVYDQDRWMPQVAAGVQLKGNNQHATLRTIGARSTTGADFHIAATKLFLAESLLLNATLRATEADQFGLLGFGGDRRHGFRRAAEGLRSPAAHEKTLRSVPRSAASPTTWALPGRIRPTTPLPYDSSAKHTSSARTSPRRPVLPRSAASPSRRGRPGSISLLKEGFDQWCLGAGR